MRHTYTRVTKTTTAPPAQCSNTSETVQRQQIIASLHVKWTQQQTQQQLVKVASSPGERRQSLVLLILMLLYLLLSLCIFVFVFVFVTFLLGCFVCCLFGMLLQHFLCANNMSQCSENLCAAAKHRYIQALLQQR